MAFKTLTIGTEAPAVVNAVIEIPKGSHNKYEYDEELDEIRLDRVLHSPVFYPSDYGFIPETRGGDGDHLDILVIGSTSVFPGCIVKARPVGVLNMKDDAGVDEKIISVSDKDPRFTHVTSITDIDEQYRNEIQHFFEVYKHLEGKKVTIKGWLGKKDAYRIIKQAHNLELETKKV